MKRKLLLALIALTCALCLVFNLAGCNPAENQSGIQQGGVKPHTHNYVYKCSQTEHWQACTVCGEGTAHTPHSVSDGVCPACGYVEKCTEGLKFEFNEGIVGYEVSDGTATDSHIFIPSFYNDLPVIYIDGYAFQYCESLKEITIGNSVISIGFNYFIWGNEYCGAFSGCTSLEEINIPDSVTYIGLFTFSGCTSLENITIPNSVTSIDEGAFSGCKRLKEITIPDGVTSIGSGAFYDTAYYNDAYNWKDDVLYIGNCLIEAKDTLSGSYQITPGTKLIADLAFSGCKSLEKITIPDSVTSIGDYAFASCISLTEITIPQSVTSIGDYAFDSCINLESIAVDKDNKVYHSEGNCIIETETKTVILGCKNSEIPEGVTSIGRYAFSGCYNLTELIIPEGVISIGEQAFYQCTSLTEITIPNSVTSIGELTFYNCVNIKTATGPTWAIEYIILGMYNAYGSPSNLQTVILTSGDSIGDNAFYCCYGLTEITIPDSVTFIGESAFYQCISLKNITIPDSVTSIGESAFYKCTSLTEITIPNSVTSIGSGAFAGCESLTEITIPNSVTSIGSGAFAGCESLESITVSEGNQTYSSQDGILYNKNKTEIIYIPKAIKGSIIIPDGVTSIGDWAFYNCTNLTEIIIPDSVTSIGNYAFLDCTSLTEITIPNSVTSIGVVAFSCCENLESVSFENTAGWKVSESYDMANFEEINVSDPEQNAVNFKYTYSEYFWKRGE